MTEWIERVERGTNPAIFLEHVLRYAFAAPLIQASSVWADLGCGSGAAAADAVDGRFAGHVVLVEKDARALASASREFDRSELSTVRADLADPAELDRIERAIHEAAPEGRSCITCYEVIEHLDDFGPLIGWLVQFVELNASTVVLSVPNDAFSGVDNPYHRTVWGEASVDELRSLLPEPQVVCLQYPLTGSCIQPATMTRHQVSIEADAQRVPSHYLIAFGARASELAPTAAVVQLDLDEHRHWERQREADLDYFRQLAGRSEAEDSEAT